MKKISKSLSLFMAMMLLINTYSFSVFAKQNEISFKVSDVVVEKGDETATVTISVDKHQGITAADMRVNCDLEILSIESDKLDIFSSIKTGKINWSYAKNSNEHGELIYVTFAIPKEPAQKTWIVELEVIEVVDENINELSYNVKNGSVSVDIEPEKDPDTQSWFVILWNEIILFFKSIISFFNSIFTL